MKKRTVLLLLGTLCLLAALGLTIWNLHTASRAQTAAATAVQQLEPLLRAPAQQVSAEAPDASGPAEPELPDYLLNPCMAMPVVVVDGVAYIGVLEIPALELTLPVTGEWSYDRLKIALCRYAGSAYLDNLVIMGHNYPAFFKNLGDLRPGDEITAVNGEAIAHNASGTQALREAVQTGETIALTVSRGGAPLSTDVSTKTLQEEDGAQAYQLGVTFATRNYGFFEAIPASGKMMVNVTEQMFTTLKNLIFHGTGADEMTGTVGTVVVISEVVQRDSSMIWDIIFLISLNLGIMNLLPIPALDGGRLFFQLIELIFRKPVPLKYEGMIHTVGLLLLLLLMAVVTFKDIFGIFT